MAARENYYAESTGDSSTTSTSAQTKVTLNWTPGAASTDYLVIWSAQINQNSTGSDIIVEFKDDGGTVRGAANYEVQDTTDYHPVFGIWKYTSSGSPSAISFTLTYRTESGQTGHIREARIFVMRMGANDAYAALDSTDTETTTSFEVAANLTFTPPSIGDYLIIGSAEMNFSTTTGELIHKLTHGGTDYGTAQVRLHDSSNFVCAGVVLKKSLAASSQSIDWNFARSSTGAGTASCRNSRIAAIRLDAFADNYYGEVRASRATSTSTTYSNFATVTDTPLAARDHLIIGSCVRDHNSTGNSAFTKLRTGGGDLIANTLQEGVTGSATIDVPSFCQMLRRTEATSSTTWSIAYATESAGTSTGIDEGSIIVLDLEAVGATAYEIAADAGSYTVTGQTAGTQRGRVVAADAGNYSVTGQNAALSKGLNLDAGAGSYSVTGQDATFNRNRVVEAGAGSYAVTGQTAALEHDKLIDAGSGNYTVTGQNAALAKGLTVAAEAGAYTTTGQDATFDRTYAVDANAGNYAVAGQDATFNRDRIIEADEGSYAVTGSDASLEYTAAEFCPEGVTFDGTDSLTRASSLSGTANGRAGSVSIWAQIGNPGAVMKFIGTPNHFSVRRYDNDRIQIDLYNTTTSQAFTFRTANAYGTSGWINILASWDVDHSAGNKIGHLYINDVPDYELVGDAFPAFDINYEETGFAVGAAPNGSDELYTGDLARVWFSTEYIDFSIEANRRKFIAADGGAEWLGSNGSLPTGNQPILYLEGPAADFHLNRGSGGDFTVTGTLTAAADDPPCAGELALNADAGGYSITGQTALLEFNRQLIADGGSYSVTGQDVTLQYGKTLEAGAGNYSVTGQTADLYLTRLIEANAGGYVLTGQDVTLTLGKIIGADEGSYLLAGSDVDLIHAQNIHPGNASIENTVAGAALSGSVPGSALSSSSAGASISGSKPGASISGSVGGAAIQ